MSDFITTCPYCNTKLQVKDEWRGMKTACPLCYENFVISCNDQQPAGPSPDANVKNCPFCGEIIKKQAVFCKHCRQHLKPFANPNEQNSRQNATPPKQRIAYILFGIFLGGLGIHNFYAGYSGKGTTQLLISLLTGWLILPYIAVFIWTVIEICTIDKDANGVPFC